MQKRQVRQDFSRSTERANSSSASILLWLFLHLKFFLCDISSEQSLELKWLMWNKHKRWFHSSRVKFLWSVCLSWFLVSMYLIWILESRLIRSKNPSSATLWVLETCLTIGLLPLIINYLYHCFVVFKHIQQSFLMRRLDVWRYQINIIQIIDHSEIACVCESCKVENKHHVCSSPSRHVLYGSHSCYKYGNDQTP